MGLKIKSKILLTNTFLLLICFLIFLYFSNRVLISFLISIYTILLSIIITLLLDLNKIIGNLAEVVTDLVSKMKADKGDNTLKMTYDRGNKIEITNQHDKTIGVVSYRDEELKASYEDWNYSLERLFQSKGFNQPLNGMIFSTDKFLSVDQTAIFLVNNSFKMNGLRNLKGEKALPVIISQGESCYRQIMNNRELRIIHSYDFKHSSGAFNNQLSKEAGIKKLLYLPALEEKRIAGFVNFLAEDTKMDAVIVDNEQLMERERKTYFEMIISLVMAMNIKDPYTKGHSERVMKYSLRLGHHLNLTKAELDILKYGSILHDIGKLAIPNDILLKKGMLTHQEYSMIKSHSVKGSAMISSLSFLQPALPIIRNHHERYDGKGYPDGLAGTEIPLLTRIVTIADSYDAMTSEREYRKKLTKGEGITELKRHRGTQFDPLLVDEFIKII